MDLIYGRNSIRAAVKNRMQIDKIYIAEGITDGSIKELIKLAKDSSIPISTVPRKKIDEMCIGLGYENKLVNHQGIAAQIPAVNYSDIDDIFNYASEKNETPFIIIADCIQDPHNLGAIIRSAEAFGAHGVIIGKHRSALLTSSAFKASSGAAAYLPIVKVTNINQTICALKKRDVWLAATDTKSTPIYNVNLKGPLAVVIGTEGTGISKHTKELCDIQISVPLHGKTESLNASCAAAIIMYEKIRQESING